MVTKIRLVQGDTRPYLVLSLYDSRTNAPIDLSDPATKTRVLFREVGSDEVKAVMNAQVVPGRWDTAAQDVDYSPPYNLPGSGGRIVVMWPPNALDTAGEFEAEAETTFADGTVQTAYNLLKFTVREQFNG